MKKLIYIFLILSLILSLFSCTTTPETPPTSEEIEEALEPEYTDESPFDFVLASIGNNLYKVYPEEGILMPACSDPLCNHNSASCAFSKIGQLQIKGERIYYTRYNANQRCVFKICSYDFSTDEYSLLYEVDKNDHITYLHASDKYLYFNVTSGLMGTKNNQKLRLMRYNLETGEVESLDDKLHDYTQVLCEKEGRLYWYNGLDFYSTDINYENKMEDDRGYHHGYCTGGYAIYVQPTGNIIGSQGAKFPEEEVIRVDLKTREESVFFKSTGTAPMVYNGKVIYTRDEEAVLLGERYDSSNKKSYEVYDKFGSKLYICNIDGSEDRLLCDFSGNNLMMQVSGFAGVYFGKGDYILYRVWYYEPVKENRSTYSGAMTGYYSSTSLPVNTKY